MPFDKLNLPFHCIPQKPNDDVNMDQKGFYISFDNTQPKRPKPPLRTKRSPKKERSADETDKLDQIRQLERELNAERHHNGMYPSPLHLNHTSNYLEF